MAEGGGAEHYTRALALFRKDRKTYFELAEKLTAAVIAHLQMQIKAGADAVQIFDSHGGLLAPTEFQEASGRWMKEIISELRTSNPELPIIVFSLGTHGNWDDLLATGANVLGIDWRFPLADARRLLPGDIGLQGNLAPALLSDATPETVSAETSRLLEAMRGRNGYIFNLGHGVPPEPDWKTSPHWSKRCEISNDRHNSPPGSERELFVTRFSAARFRPMAIIWPVAQTKGHEPIERQSGFGAEIQRGRAALYQLSARDEIHRRDFVGRPRRED